MTTQQLVTLPPAFPLAWPEDWTRTLAPARKSSPYRVTAEAAREELYKGLVSLGASDIAITTDLPLRIDGKPMLSARPPADPGVAVWWIDLKQKRAAAARGEPAPLRVLACDQWLTLRENLRACGLAIEALRALERSKATQILDRAVAAFDVKALTSGPPWWAVVLELDHARRFTADDVQRAFKARALTRHPDQGGTLEQWHELERARTEALRHV